MRFSTYLSLLFKVALAVALTFLSVTILFGQDESGKGEKVYKAEKAEKAEKAFKAEKIKKEFCSGNSWSDDARRVPFKEVREMTLPASGTLNVDGGRNGGVSVIGENRSDVLVRACVQTWGATEEEARSLAGGVKISTSPVKAEGASDENWSVSFEVRVPNNTDLQLKAHNGGISIRSVEGTLDFETTNGGVNLSSVAGNVKGRTTNGGVNVTLSGNAWRGSGLDVQTSNGGVNLSLPETYAANIETGTVNGGFNSNIPALNVTTENVQGERMGRARGVKINTAINGGGAPIRVVTTNGGIRINASERGTN